MRVRKSLTIAALGAGALLGGWAASVSEARASEPAAAALSAMAIIGSLDATPSRWNTKELLSFGDLTIGGRGRAPLLYQLDRNSEDLWRAVAARPVRGGGMLAFELHWGGMRTVATAGK
jgi:hypothetical protein